MANEDGFEIYYTVLPEHQNVGRATEASKVLIEYVFDKTETDRLVAFVISANVPSIRVAETAYGATALCRGKYFTKFRG